MQTTNSVGLQPDPGPFSARVRKGAKHQPCRRAGAGGLIGAAGGVGPESGKYDRLNAEASEFFETVDIDDAEVLIYPYRADGGPEIERVANEARKRGIGCVFISWGDADEPVEVSHGTVYRHSLFAGSRLPHEEATPAEVCDPQEELSRTIFPRDKVTRPSVGFCGFVSNPIVRTVYRLMGRNRKAEGLSLRQSPWGVAKKSAGFERNLSLGKRIGRVPAGDFIGITGLNMVRATISGAM